MLNRIGLAAAGGISAAAAATLLVGAPAADALTPVYQGPVGHFNANYVNIRNQPTTKSTAIEGQGQKGQAFCFNGLGYGSGGDWAYGTDQPTSVTGYVLGSYLTYIQGQQCVVV
jgi:hypothetical protein